MPRILVIDDDNNVRASVVAFLLRLGHDVQEAEDGKRALRVMSGVKIDLVITDINMPEMDGIEIIRALQDKAGSAPVIAMSGGGLVDKHLLLDSAQMLGAVTTMAKPFDLEDLRRAVEAALSDSSKNKG